MKRHRAFTLVELPVVSRRKRGAFTLVELLVVIGIVTLLIAPAAAAPYLFAEVAQTEAYPADVPVGAAARTGPALNEVGAVAFRRISGGIDGIYTRAPGGPLVPVTTSAGGQFRAFGAAPDLNDAGAVVFHAFPSAGGEGLYVAAPGAPVVTVADTAAGAFTRFVPSTLGDDQVALPAINNAGVVTAVGVRPNDLPSERALLHYAGGSLTTPAVGQVFYPDVNERGEVAFFDNHRGVRLLGPAGIRTVSRSLSGQPRPNHIATLNDGGVVLYAWTGFEPIVLVEGDNYREIHGLPPANHALSLNNRGEIAYLGFARNIMAGDPAAPERVLGVGDELFGSTVERLAFSREGFNDAGQVAFWASLADGRNVIALATPVPEPAAAGLLVVAAARLALRRRRRRLS